MLQFFILFSAIVIMLNGMIRWFISGIIRITGSTEKGIRKNYANQPTVSILLPCYNEGKAVYNTIEALAASDYPEGLMEIIATDDCSIDDSWDWILKAAQDFKTIKVTPVRNPHNMGKTKTILNALAASSREIVCIVDSDTIVAPRAIKELMACLADERLGGAGGPAAVSNPNDNSLTMFQVYLYYLSFHLGKAVESYFRTVGCVGGQLFAIRRLLFEDIRPQLEGRNWFGAHCIDGEDRFITHQILLRGYGTYIDVTAENVSAVPNTFKSYWGQQLRWRRSATRDFFFTMRRLPEHMKKIGPMGIYVYFLTPLVQFVAILDILFIAVGGLTGMAIMSRVMGFLGVTFLIFLLSFEVYKGDSRVKNPLGMVTWFSWYIVNNMLLVPLALFTLDSGSWGNRDQTNQGRK